MELPAENQLSASSWPPMERWWGFRPCTPDEGPILGRSNLDGLWIATGHYRNGVLLAAITAELITKSILHLPMDLEEESLLKAFSFNRFFEKRVNDIGQT